MPKLCKLFYLHGVETKEQITQTHKPPTCIINFSYPSQVNFTESFGFWNNNFMCCLSICENLQLRFVWTEPGVLIKTMRKLFVVKLRDEYESHACISFLCFAMREGKNSNTKLRSAMIIFNYNSEEKRFASSKKKAKMKNLL